MQDAKEVGLIEVVTCIGNRNAAPGTIVARLSEEVKEILYSRDIIN